MPAALIMAAGHGTRMRSRTPKVLHPVCGRPMLEWVVDAARGAGADRVVAIVRPDSGVAESVGDGVEVAEQREGEGTASAVDAARDLLKDEDTILLLSGDHPLITSDLLTQLLRAHEEQGAQATMLTTDTLDPTAYGRIVRDKKGRVERDRRDEGRDEGLARAPRDPRDQPRHLRLQRAGAVRRARARSSPRRTESAT